MKRIKKGFTPRVWVTVAIVAVAGLLTSYTILSKPEPQPDHAQASLRVFGLDEPVQNRLDARFADADGDLVADTPRDPANRSNPDTLVFSYIANEAENAQLATAWRGFTDHLSHQTGKPVRYESFPSPTDQLKALKNGTLHVTGLNAGNVPIAVNDCGFVPLVTVGNAEGVVGYSMQLIVPADSDVHSVDALRGKTLALTQIGSNSGFKAPLVLLMQDFGLQVERDYYIQVSRGHDASILGVAEGQYQAAAVASDLLQRAIADGVIAETDVRVLYSSERFVPAGLGVLHSLEPSLVEGVQEAFDTFDWNGNPLADQFAGSTGPPRFVPVNYKDHWALIRRIDDAIGFRHVVE